MTRFEELNAEWNNRYNNLIKLVLNPGGYSDTEKQDLLDYAIKLQLELIANNPDARQAIVTYMLFDAISNLFSLNPKYAMMANNLAEFNKQTINIDEYAATSTGFRKNIQ